MRQAVHQRGTRLVKRRWQVFKTGSPQPGLQFLRVPNTCECSTFPRCQVSTNQPDNETEPPGVYCQVTAITDHVTILSLPSSKYELLQTPPQLLDPPLHIRLARRSNRLSKTITTRLIWRVLPSPLRQIHSQLHLPADRTPDW